MTKNSTTTEPRTSASYHHGDLRAALIDASVELVSSVGSDAFTLKDASRIAGVSVAAPYRHFSDKSELLHEVTEVTFKKMSGDMHRALKGQELGTIESLIALGQAYVRFAHQNPHLFKLIFENHDGGLETNLEEIFNSGNGGPQLAELLDIGNQDIQNYPLAQQAPHNGIACYSILLKNVATFLDRNGLDVDETLAIATPLWALVHGTSFLLIDQKFQTLTPSVDTDDIVARTTRYFLNGLLQEKATNQ